jgi:hypothetical protein
MHSQESGEEEMAKYTGRVSPMLSPGSSLTSTVPPASYERERDGDRESGERDRAKVKRARSLLPPTPVSAEPRHQTRRSVVVKHERS